MKKGLIFDIRRYSVHDGPGIRTTVFLKGCPLNCVWCHNPESVLTKPQIIRRCRQIFGKSREIEETIGSWMESGEVMHEILRDRLFFEESDGGVTFSGGEPLAQPDFLKDLLIQCREAGIHTAVDTSGHAPLQTFQEVASYANTLLFDLKTLDKEKHLAYTGEDNTLIINNLMSLPKEGPGLFIRIPVIPGFNSQIRQMELMRDLLSRVRATVVQVNLLPYHHLGRHKYEALGMDPPPGFGPEISREQMHQLMKVFSEAGFEVKQGG